MKHTPLRSCIVCRAQKAKRELVRIVKAPDGSISLDLTGRADGRGAYICRGGNCARELTKKRALSRVFKTQVPDEVYAQIIQKLGELDNDAE